MKKNTKKEVRNILLICLLVIMVNIPFLNEAHHIDDVLHLPVAKHILKDPLHPYSFDLFLGGRITTVFENEGNPPFGNYYEALILLISESEFVLHFFMVLFSLIGAISMYYLSKKYIKKPLIPTLLLMFSPTIMIMSHTLMTDIIAFSLFLASLTLFVYGDDKNNYKLLVLSGIFGGLAILTKYFCLILIPILLLYSFIKKRWFNKNMYFALIPLLFLFVWEFYNFITYGRTQIFITFGQINAMLLDKFARTITSFTHIGGLILLPFMYHLIKKHKRTYLFVLILSIIFTLIFKGIVSPHYTTISLILLALFISFTLFFLLTHLTKNFFLMSTIIIIILGNIFMIIVGAARYIMYSFPMIVILFCMYNKKLKYVLVGMLLLGLSLSYADYQYANIYRDVSKLEGFDYYIGTWGIELYMKIPMFNGSAIEGETIIQMHPFCTQQEHIKPIENSKLIKTIYYHPKIPVHVFNGFVNAGFYAHSCGYLPYSFSFQPIDYFDIYQIT